MTVDCFRLTKENYRHSNNFNSIFNWICYNKFKKRRKRKENKMIANDLKVVAK